MKGKISRIIIFCWTILSFLIDLYMAIISKAITSGFGVIAIILGVLICCVAYKMLIGRRWGLILMAVFYGFHSFNIHTDTFTFYTKSGLNIELGIGTDFSVNLFTLILFILLIVELTRRTNVSADEIL